MGMRLTAVAVVSAALWTLAGCDTTANPPVTATGTGTGTGTSPNPSFCIGEVAGMYGVRPTYVAAGPPTAMPDGTTVIDGTVDKGNEGIKKFRCNYDNAGSFKNVTAMTPDGE